MTTLDQQLQLVVKIAKDAGALVRHHYGNVERLTKTHVATSNEAVTEADRASQRLIIKELRNTFPDDGIIGEESDTGTSITFDVKDINGRNWVIDPIDGTNNFISGLAAFAVCIGLLDNGYPVLGVVYDVTRDKMYTAAKGFGAKLDDVPIHARTTPMSDSTMLMMTSNLLNKHGQAPGWACRWIGQTEWKARILGSAALEAAQVAAGVAHGAVTVNGKLWDVVAPAAVVLESGGLLSDLEGNAIFPFDLKDYQGAKVPFLAAGPAAHATLLAEIENNP